MYKRTKTATIETTPSKTSRCAPLRFKSQPEKTHATTPKANAATQPPCTYRLAVFEPAALMTLKSAINISTASKPSRSKIADAMIKVSQGEGAEDFRVSSA